MVCLVKEGQQPPPSPPPKPPPPSNPPPPPSPVPAPPTGVTPFAVPRGCSKGIPPRAAICRSASINAATLTATSRTTPVATAPNTTLPVSANTTVPKSSATPMLIPLYRRTLRISRLAFSRSRGARRAGSGSAPGGLALSLPYPGYGTLARPAALAPALTRRVSFKECAAFDFDGSFFDRMF